jgi:hypothetical protein
LFDAALLSQALRRAFNVVLQARRIPPQDQRWGDLT